MANIDKHAPGSFCWIELGTTDQASAKKFYSGLYGWEAQDSPMGPDAYYTMFQLQGRDAAAAYGLDKNQLAMGIPPHWNLYIATENADSAASKVAELGGKVLVQPFDVMEYGRMAVLQDPTGVPFSLWQAKAHPGVEITAVDGTLCWADLSSPDPKRASDFYRQVFGWTYESDPHSGYLHIKNGDSHIGGVPSVEQRAPATPPHWLAYFQVPDCDAAAGKAKQLGGKIMHEMKMEGVGNFAIMADPQGAISALFQSRRK